MEAARGGTMVVVRSERLAVGGHVPFEHEGLFRGVVPMWKVARPGLHPHQDGLTVLSRVDMEPTNHDPRKTALFPWRSPGPYR